MDRGKDNEPDPVEWIDLDQPASSDRIELPGWRWRWHWWYAVVALALIGSVILVVRQPDAKQALPAPSRPRATTERSSLPETTPAESPTPAITVRNIGHPLLEVPHAWELFGLGPAGVVRIQLALGRITSTAVPPVNSDGPESFVVGPDRAVIRPLDFVPGYLVPDGQPARELPGTLGQGGPAVPGPDRNHLWVQTGSGAHTAMTLVGFDGRSTNETVPVPSGGFLTVSDGAGYLVVNATGGTYDARPDGLHRITTGSLLAIGPTRWLTEECDDQHRCSTVVTDRASGQRRILDTPVDRYELNGVISPDGSTAALLVQGPQGVATVHLLDLASGVDRTTGVTVDVSQGFGSGAFVWTPDSRWLLAAAANGRPSVVDGRSGHTRYLGASVAPITQVALRVPA